MNSFIAAGGQGCVSLNVISLRSATKTIECRSEEDCRRAEREVTVLQKLRHNNIVLYYDHAWDATIHTMLLHMELCGPSLRYYIEKEGRKLGKEIQVLWCHDVLSALAYLKQEKVLHRDLKPENILVTEAGPLMGTVKLCDFGICKIKVTGAITQNNLMYTEGYLAPEVMCADDFSHESDLYAFGVTIWELIQRRSSKHFNREDLKEDGPALLSLVYKCTDVVERRITLENAVLLVDNEKQKVIGKERVDFGKLLFDRQTVISISEVTPGALQLANTSNSLPSLSSSTIDPQLPSGFLETISEPSATCEELVIETEEKEKENEEEEDEESENEEEDEEKENEEEGEERENEEEGEEKENEEEDEEKENEEEDEEKDNEEKEKRAPLEVESLEVEAECMKAESCSGTDGKEKEGNTQFAAKTPEPERKNEEEEERSSQESQNMEVERAESMEVETEGRASKQIETIRKAAAKAQEWKRNIEDKCTSLMEPVEKLERLTAEAEEITRKEKERIRKMAEEQEWKRKFNENTKLVRNFFRF